MYMQRNFKKKISIEKKTNKLYRQYNHTLLFHINQWSWQVWPISNPDCDWRRCGDDDDDDDDDDDNDDHYDNLQ